MKLEEARNHYYDHSRSLSSVNRQLGFAGIAIIWIFATQNSNGEFLLPSNLYCPLAFFVCGLALDLLQYMVATASWGIFHRLKEKSGVGENQDFTASPKINWAPIILLWAKSIATISGYISLYPLFFK